MPFLPYIADEDLIAATRKLLDAGERAKAAAESNPYKNVIDPFSALIEAASQGMTLEQWMAKEKDRQIQKAFQNAIGTFHQEIIGSIYGWKNPGIGGSYDAINEERKILAELKNKHNTMNSTSAAGTYDKLAGWIDFGKSDFTAYLVSIVPKSPTPVNVPFTPSERNVRRPVRENLRSIDGRSFYAIATDYPDALDQLFKAMPQVIGVILDRDLNRRVYNEFNVLFDKAYGGI